MILYGMLKIAQTKNPRSELDACVKVHGITVVLRKGILNIPAKRYNALYEDFVSVLKYEIETFGESWTNTKTVYGTVTEQVLFSGSKDDCIAIPIQNQDVEDGGYVHVFGWKEMKSQ